MSDHAKFEETTWKFEKILRGLGIYFASKGPCEEQALALVQMGDHAKDPSKMDCSIDLRESWRRALAFADLAQKVVLVSDHPNFETLAPHLKLFGGIEDLSLFSFTNRENQANDKIFELYVASACLRFMDNVAVDHPERSKGTNPDVMGDFRGRRWAIACKALHTDHPKTFLDRVEEGVKQIEFSNAERGIVALNMKNTFSHDEVWPAAKLNGNYYYRCFKNINEAQASLSALSDKLFAGVIELVGRESAVYEHLFNGKKQAVPYIMLVYSTVVGIERDGPCYSAFRLAICRAGLKADQDSEKFLDELNVHLQQL